MLLPFENLSAPTRRRALVMMCLLASLSTAAMAWIDHQYRTRAAPQGIVSLQMAGNSTLAQWILDQWSAGPGMNAWVAFGLGVDYLYLIIYGLTFVLISASIAARLALVSPSAAKVARLIGYLQLVAPACDAIENVGSMAMLARYGTDFWAPFTTGFALAKFACLGAFGALVVFSAPAVWRAGQTPSPSPT